MKNIFEIKNEYLQLMDQIEEAGGELTPETEHALAINQATFAEKSINYAMLIKTIEGRQQLIKQEIERLQNIQKRSSKLVERLETTLKDAMILYDRKKLEYPLLTISIRDSHAVEIIDASKIPAKFKMIVQEEKISKKEIGEALKNGESVEGAEMKTNHNLVIK